MQGLAALRWFFIVRFARPALTRRSCRTLARSSSFGKECQCQPGSIASARPVHSALLAGRWLCRLLVALVLLALRSSRCQCLRSALAAPARFGNTASLLRSTPQTLRKSPASAQLERTTQQRAVWLPSCSPENRWRSTRVKFNSNSALTLPSSGRARAGRATLVLHRSLRAASPYPPLMSNVSAHSSPPNQRDTACANHARHIPSTITIPAYTSQPAEVGVGVRGFESHSSCSCSRNSTDIGKPEHSHARDPLLSSPTRIASYCAQRSGV